MGLIQHNSVIISGNSAYQEQFRQVYEYAQQLFGTLVTPVIQPEINGDMFFFISPDGSKEGWSISNEYDTKRSELCDFIDSFACDDGSNSVRYVDVSHGEKGAFIERTNEENYYADESEDEKNDKR